MSNILSEVHPELVAEWSERNLPLTPDKITYGSNKIVWWIGTCGHEWQTSVKARSNGEKCPVCSGARVVEGVNDLATLKPELVAEWSSKNNALKPTMVTVGSHKKVIWKGKCGHEWTATVKSRAISGTGCPYCSHNKVLEGFNDLASQRPLIASEWSERNYPLKPNMVTVFANRKVWWKCSKGHEWNALISTRSGGSQCPYCSGQIYAAAIPMAAVYLAVSTLIQSPIFSVGIGLASIVPSVLMINTKIWFAYPMSYPFYLIMVAYGRAAEGVYETQIAWLPWLPVAVGITILALVVSCMRYGASERR